VGVGEGAAHTVLESGQRRGGARAGGGEREGGGGRAVSREGTVTRVGTRGASGERIVAVTAFSLPVEV